MSRSDYELVIKTDMPTVVDSLCTGCVFLLPDQFGKFSEYSPCMRRGCGVSCIQESCIFVLAHKLTNEEVVPEDIVKRYNKNEST